MSFWETVTSDIIALLAVGAITYVVSLIYLHGKRLIGKRPDFILEWAEEGAWILRRTRRRTAFQLVHQTHDKDGMMGPEPGPSFQPDLKFGDKEYISRDEAMHAVLVRWIDGARYRETIYTAGRKSIPLTAQRPRRILRWVTRNPS